MAYDTGNGTTLAFTSGSFTARITSIEPGSKSREALDSSGLDTTGDAEMDPGDLWRHDAWTVNYLVDVTDAAKTEPPVGVDTLTITAPSQAVGSDATWAGTGFVKSIQSPTLENDQLMSGSFEWQFDGKTGPAFTAEAA